MPTGEEGPRKLDLLLVVDDSSAMMPIQERFGRQFERLLAGLEDDAGKLPDLHIAVITPNMGAGAHTVDFVGTSSSGCARPENGKFVTAARAPDAADRCAQARLEAGETFLKENGTERNYVGELPAVLDCLTQVGTEGCGFEQPLAAIRAALGDDEGGVKAPKGNRDFLRADAHLAVVILTNEDDCSVPTDSELLDPSQAAESKLGSYSSFRCVRVGLLCAGASPPDNKESGKLKDCVPNDALATMGATQDERESNRLRSLVPTTVYKEFFEKLRPAERRDILLLGGPTGPVLTLYGRNMILPSSNPNDVGLGHTCASVQTGIFADPPVRLAALVSSMDGTVSPSICGELGEPLELFGRHVRDRL